MTGNLVSIVLCTYNGILYIDDQLNSILRQTYSITQIIISDDFSNDGTFERLEEYAEKDNRIQLARNTKNLGYNQNFSNACNLSTGDYIAIADQDDIWEPEKINILLSEITHHDDVVLVHCISAKFETITKPKLRNVKFLHSFNGNDIRQLFIRNPVPGHNMLFKRVLLQAALPFPADIFYDWWLIANACCIGKIKAVDNILVWHRIHANNATRPASSSQPFCVQVQKILPVLLRLNGLKPCDKKFGEKLLAHYNELSKKALSPALFFFLLRYAAVFFAYKKRIFPWFSYLKAAFILSFKN